MNDNETPNTVPVPYLPSSQVKSDEPINLVNDFSAGYVNKTFTTASRLSEAAGVNSALNQVGLNKYSDKWTTDTTKNLLSALAIIMLLNKFKQDGIPFLKANWKPAGMGMIALAYLLYLSKQKDEEQKTLVASIQRKSTSFGVRG